ncbi:MAG: heat-inducible transcription repressor HrcA [Candidatus Riflebacteria bacterium]|nr:heat-inducible transcription repressor HrcA [Candidatus Riflebacteria bacterium]
MKIRSIETAEAFPKLNERQRLVLKDVCDSFISTGIPVGSRTISKFCSLNCSPATIRNEMADLESMGLLTSPHTSSGRVPTELGYRFFVNYLLEFERLSQLEESIISILARKFEEEHQEKDKFLRSAIRLASDFTSLTGMALPPKKCEKFLKTVQIIRLFEDKVLLIFVDHVGNFTEHVLPIPSETNDDDLQKLSNFLNVEVCNRDLSTLEPDLFKKSQRILSKFNSVLSMITSQIKKSLENPVGNEVFLEGFIHFFERKEFKDQDKMKSLIELLERKEELLKILVESLENGDDITVKVGSDSGLAVADLAVVTARYQGPNKTFGRIGLIGPMRMDYARVLGTLVNISRTISLLFTGASFKTPLKF